MSNTVPSLGNDDIYRIRQYTREHGGGTFTPNGIAINPDAGYALSVDDARGIEIPIEDMTDTVVQVWAMNNLDYIVNYSRIPRITNSMKFIGTWIDHGMFYLDVATVFRNTPLEDVMHLALDNGQRAVYDFSTGDCIYTDEYFGKDR